jgi:hypothetical protein
MSFPPAAVFFPSFNSRTKLARFAAHGSTLRYPTAFNFRVAGVVSFLGRGRMYQRCTRQAPLPARAPVYADPGRWRTLNSSLGRHRIVGTGAMVCFRLASFKLLGAAPGGRFRQFPRQNGKNRAPFCFAAPVRRAFPGAVPKARRVARYAAERPVTVEGVADGGPELLPCGGCQRQPAGLSPVPRPWGGALHRDRADGLRA